MSQDNVNLGNVAFLTGAAAIFAAMMLFAVGGFLQATVAETDSQVTIERVDGYDGENVPGVSFNDLDSDEQKILIDAVNDGSATGITDSHHLSYTLFNGEPINGEHTGFRSALMYTWLESYEGVSVEDTQQTFSVYQNVDGETYTFAVTDVSYGGKWFNTLHAIKNVAFGLSSILFVLFVLGIVLTPILNRYHLAKNSSGGVVEKNKHA